MKKYRKFIIPVVMIVLIVSFVIPSFADDYSVTMKELFGYKNGVVSCSWFAQDRFYASNFFWYSDNELRITDVINEDEDSPVVLPNIKDGGSISVSFGTRYALTSEDYLYFKVPALEIFPLGVDTTNLGTYNLTVTLTFEDSVGVDHDIVIFDGAPNHFGTGNVNTASYTFEYSSNIASQYKYFKGMRFFTTFYDASFSSYRLNFYAYEWEWFLGNREYAPIYDGPDTSYLDDLKAQEDFLREQTVGGIQDAGNVLGVLSQVIGPGTSAGEGLLGVTALLTPVFEPFLSFLLISLSIGLIMFIIGTVSWIQGKSSKGNKVKGGKS